MSELWFTPAYELADRVRSSELSPLELMEACLARIEETVEDERGGKSRGLAVFAGQNLWQVYRLPMAPGNHIVIDRTPHVKPLIHLFRRHPRFCAVLVDKERARLFLIQMGEIQDYSMVLSEVPKHHEQGGFRPG